jgi:hypothetical protein
MCVALPLLFARFVISESEAKTVQSRLAKIWVEFDDRRRRAWSWQNAFVSMVASKTAFTLDRNINIPRLARHGLATVARRRGLQTRRTVLDS